MRKVWSHLLSRHAVTLSAITSPGTVAGGQVALVTAAKAPGLQLSARQTRHTPGTSESRESDKSCWKCHSRQHSSWL